MTRYLIDTSVLVDLSKGVRSTTTRVKAFNDAQDDLCICAVVLAEFMFGTKDLDRPQAERLFGSLRFLPASRSIAIAAGRDRYAFARRGITIATADALIAATARAWNATVLTENIKDFPMPDVRVMSLRT